MIKYTKEEKKAYFKALRDRWSDAKEASASDVNAQAKYQAIQSQAPDFKISYTSFYFTLLDMRHQKLSGDPYIDAKTFQGWIKAGFQVIKGQKSTLKGVTWIKAGAKDTDNDADGFLFPKEYALFHTSQVQAI